MHAKINTYLTSLGLPETIPCGSTGKNWIQEPVKGNRKIQSPVDGYILGTIPLAERSAYDQVVEAGQKAFPVWRKIPSPARGEIIRQIGMALRKNKEDLGALVSYEMGKSFQEGKGEVQEMIDICDFATGLSRNLYGKTIPSERPNHRMLEQYHPLGIIGIISAFNFPVAVWSWNAALAWVCGNVCVWKPSEKTPFSALACQLIVSRVFEKNGIPEGVSGLVLGDMETGKSLAGDSRIALVSATGSVRMGRSVGITVAERMGKSILELGGNNAIILSENANLEKVFAGIVFGSIGTAGQRCTSTRRLIIHESIYEEVCTRLKKAYSRIRIGDPLLEENHMGPLIDLDAVKAFTSAMEKSISQGGTFLVEGKVLTGPGYESGCYVSPCIVQMPSQTEIVQEETFAPILYLLKYKDLSEAIQIHNQVRQGLSSALMTDNILEAEYFLSQEGSDCGISNINIGTSGAEIGGAFGGEKETGGGRESGSDAWKAYMRRQTNTINYGSALPLAQGIQFDI